MVVIGYEECMKSIILISSMKCKFIKANHYLLNINI